MHTSTERNPTRHGYVMLPCFTVDINGCDIELTCSDFLSVIFSLFFAPFWSGKIILTD